MKSFQDKIYETNSKESWNLRSKMTGGYRDIDKKKCNKMKVWIDQDLCTGDGLCAEIAPDVFTMKNDGLAYVQEVVGNFGDLKYLVLLMEIDQGAEGLARSS